MAFQLDYVIQGNDKRRPATPPHLPSPLPHTTWSVSISVKEFVGEQQQEQAGTAVSCLKIKTTQTSRVH